METQLNEQTAPDIQALNERIKLESAFLDVLRMEMNKVIVGQSAMVDGLILGLLANGHILLEGVPGLAKTLAITTLSKCIKADFSRVQFTPDLLPADLIGTQIYSPKNESFSIKKGPIFAHLILADEINRSPAKVQSALLEAMQEKQITIGAETFTLPDPFLVMATQNPVEQEGTYPLPEAQVDRFMLKIVLDYPSPQEEQNILKNHLNQVGQGEVQAVVEPKQIIQAREAVQSVYMDEKIQQYIVDLVYATRKPSEYGLKKEADWIQYGASPRATVALAQTAKAQAFMNHRGYVIPEDVRAVCMPVLRHRIGLTYEAEAEEISSEHVVHALLNQVAIP